MHRCPTCGARLGPAAICPSCGASRRETHDTPTVAYDHPAPTPQVEDDYPDNPPPRCKCSHGPSQHSRGRGQCWALVCGCQSYRPKEAITR